jgi:small subunit ribosomal protein S1
MVCSTKIFQGLHFQSDCFEQKFEPQGFIRFIETMTTRHPFPEAGSRLKGRVVELLSSGAILDIGNGLKGFLHESQISWLTKRAIPSENLRIGEEIEVVVLPVKPSKRQRSFASLSLLPTQTNPWESVKEKHPVGSRINATVVDIRDFGVLVRFATGFRALIHNSEVSWVERTPKARELFRPGDEIEVVIQFVDVEKRRIIASYRHACENPWEALLSKYPIGSSTNGKVESLQKYGVFVSLPNGCIGLLHHSQFRNDLPTLRPGDFIQVIVLEFDMQKNRISLGLPTTTQV